MTDNSIRDTLKQAASIARSLGFDVRASTSDNCISSYYCVAGRGECVMKYGEGDGGLLRISDHYLEANHKRDYGYSGMELIIDSDCDADTLRDVIVRIWTKELDYGIGDLSQLLEEL